MTGFDDLPQVFKAVRDLVNWQFLGLELGISYPMLEMIERNNCGNIAHCKMEMLRTWLAGYNECVASWSALKFALKNIGEHVLADTIPMDSELITTFLCLYLHEISCAYMYTLNLYTS